MTAKAVEACRVYLVGVMPTDAFGNVGEIWNASSVKELVVFPDTHNARCVIKDAVHVAVYRGYVPLADSQQQWETGGEFHCEFCGQTFQSAQGLGNHRATKHAGKVAK